jgi:peptidoglycan/LPS O-acetylase OafA/YrhL
MSRVAFYYRPDIDGLRAVAVVAVVLFHAFPHSLPGGFVGVDLFFVISGFLISSIILKQLQHGNFKFADFYARRIVRIFPALLLVLVATLAFGWFALLPNEFRALGKHTAAATAFVSNFVLWSEAGYFDTAAQSKPLLHLWSLGIEEQFYLVWPLSLVLLWKWKTKILPLICLLALLSFSLNVALVDRSPSLDFYFPTSRIWELLIGSALASGTLQSDELPSPTVSNCLAVLGSLLIGSSLLLLNERRMFPGWWALLPTLGAAFLISAGPQAWINRRVLASPAFIFVGLISYPLYLWHWPLLTYLRLIVDSDYALGSSFILFKLLRLGTLAISACLAWATWRFWEAPLRQRNTTFRSAKVRGLVAALIVVSVLGGFSVAKFVTPRLNKPAVVKIVQAIDDWDYPSGDNSAHSVCTVNTIRSHSDRLTLFVGDSHIEQYWPRAKAAIKSNPSLTSAVFATHSGCLPLPGLNQGYHPEFSCPKVYEYWSGLAEAPEVETVVIGGYWDGAFLSSRARLLNIAGKQAVDADIDKAWVGLEMTVASLVRSGKRVFILSSNPASTTFDPREGFHRFRGPDVAGLKAIDKVAFNRFIAPIEGKLTQITTRTGATLIRPVDYLCDGSVCPAVDAQGAPLYRDEDHLRPATVIERATFIDRLLQP